jgi:hypothetical protein
MAFVAISFFVLMATMAFTSQLNNYCEQGTCRTYGGNPGRHVTEVGMKGHDDIMADSS